ncbi:nucleoside diphosphate-linked moiety X motif 8 [Pimephales promelas]|uniref:nucleoside diphosphate-linked moiety X motif 8 n=1 Tax=Pimephales promelas TaxID=90988 RepID=UPI001955CCDF|nr:nucleoside diphosphate-linked moiety X motif 8 [Pimephales promelas]
MALWMFRTPHVKTCVTQLRFQRLQLMLRVPHEHVCSRSSRVLRETHTGSSVALDSSEHACPRATRRTCISTHFLSPHMDFSRINWVHTPQTLVLCLNGSPSQCRLEKGHRSPEGPACSTHSTGSFGSGLWTRRCRPAGRSAVRTGQTRGLHRDGQQRSVTARCLSAGNEARCRRSMQAGAALYEREGKSWAAVLVCLCSVSGDPALLFTLRSAQLKGRHKGDVSFAGGKKDPSDRSVVETALREAGEELGIHVSEDKVWGVMKPLRDMSGMMIAPVIANLGSLERLSFRPNPSEVEEIFTLTLEHLCQAQNRGYTHFRTGDRYGYTLPVFHSPKYRIWGLTAVALDQALKLIVPPEHVLDHGAVTTEAAC